MSLHEEVLKQEKLLNSSDLLDQYFTEKIAYLISKHIFVPLRLKPNFISGLSAFTGIVAISFFVPKNFWLNVVGCLLLILSYVFDCCDGQVARMTHSGSINGRFIDGVCDGIVYLSTYVGLSLRLMDENIPFTNTPWGMWIFLVFVIIGIFFHGPQCRLVDYTRQFHMFIVSNKTKHEVSCSADLKKQLDEYYKGKMKDLTYVRLKTYYPYTLSQEKTCPNIFKLESIIRDHNLEIDPKISEELTKRISSFFVQITTSYTFNLRTYPLIVFILTDMPILFIVWTIFVLEPAKIYFKRKYEQFAKDTIDTYFPEYK